MPPLHEAQPHERTGDITERQSLSARCDGRAALSANGAKCKSLGQRPRLRVVENALEALKKRNMSPFQGEDVVALRDPAAALRFAPGCYIPPVGALTGCAARFKKNAGETPAFPVNHSTLPVVLR